MIFVPDHHIHCQSFETPVSVGLDELAYKMNISLIFNLEEHNGEITGNGVTPETRLASPVLDEDSRSGTQRGIGVYDRGGKTSIELRISFYGIDLPQEHLAVSPRQIKDAIGKAPVLIFLDKA
jgi:hypothetical protein